MTEPKKVSDFAKEYQETYIALVQCKSAHSELSKRLNSDWNKLMPRVRAVSFLPITDDKIHLYKRLKAALLKLDFGLIEATVSDIEGI